ncbi:hypothetical protein ACFOWE_24645 [Planomonospora corallina]|uniref:Uncharacterized protein n=1 Tax=Planomonospora corallina TaxID=1806052 RepID=A0ABV8II88_9ACTN
MLSPQLGHLPVVVIGAGPVGLGIVTGQGATRVGLPGTRVLPGELLPRFDTRQPTDQLPQMPLFVGIRL